MLQVVMGMTLVDPPERALGVELAPWVFAVAEVLPRMVEALVVEPPPSLLAELRRAGVAGVLETELVAVARVRVEWVARTAAVEVAAEAAGVEVQVRAVAPERPYSKRLSKASRIFSTLRHAPEHRRSQARWTSPRQTHRYQETPQCSKVLPLSPLIPRFSVPMLRVCGSVQSQRSFRSPAHRVQRAQQTPMSSPCSRSESHDRGLPSRFQRDPCRMRGDEPRQRRPVPA